MFNIGDIIKINEEFKTWAVNEHINKLVAVGSDSKCLEDLFEKQFEIVNKFTLPDNENCIFIVIKNIINQYDIYKIALNKDGLWYGLEECFMDAAFVVVRTKTSLLYCECNKPIIITASYKKDESYLYCKNCKKEYNK